jgi:BCD family chlorophyll transporter-like MFS transporter
MNVFGWTHVIRLGLIQACMGAVVVVTTSTLNRIMVVEHALPALLPGMLVSFHYLVQMVRPRMGFGADQGRRSTPWMMGGMVLLSAGGLLAAVATVWMADALALGLALAVLAFACIGLGVSACGTSLLALMSKRMPAHMRAPAATTVWMMMIMGFALTAITVGKLLDPYTPERLIYLCSILSVCVVLITAACLWRLEGQATAQVAASDERMTAEKFKQALHRVWGEAQARTFTIFVFLSMLAYSAQDLILEPFAGSIFGMTPGETTQLSGLHHSAVLCGMLCVALVGGKKVAGRLGSIQSWMVGGCALSALAMLGLTLGGITAGAWPLKANVFVLGVANGVFSIAAIATMMRLATAEGESRAGTRMGLWGAAQALAFGLGGLLGTAASDLARWLIASPGAAYASVFALEALMFLGSAWCAIQVGKLDMGKPEQGKREVKQTDRTLASQSNDLSEPPRMGQELRHEF